MAGFRMTWLGDQIKANVAEATIKGIDETLAGAVTEAQIAAPRLSGAMAGGIEIVERAARRGRRISGFWGNTTQLYTLWQEIGARGRPGRFFLRRGADLEYPKLAERIAAWLT